MLISAHDKLFALIKINRFRLFFVESKAISSRLAINNKLSLSLNFKVAEEFSRQLLLLWVDFFQHRINIPNQAKVIL